MSLTLKSKATRLHKLIRNGDESGTRKLMHEWKDNLKGICHTSSDETWTPLHAVCFHGPASLAKDLINIGVDVNLQLSKDLDYLSLRGNRRRLHAGSFPLHISAISNNFQIAEMLLMANAHINARNEHNETPLFLSCGFGYLEIVNILLTKGANVNLPDKNGITPLMNASRGSHFEIVKLLLLHNADVNTRDLEGNTALHWAAKNEFRNKYAPAILKILIEKETVINAKNDQGYSALIYAVDSLSDQTEDMLKVLIENGADVNLCSENGDSPLHFAAKHGSEKAVRLLLENGAKQFPNKRKNMPKHLAKSDSILQLLKQFSNFPSMAPKTDPFQTVPSAPPCEDPPDYWSCVREPAP